MPDWDENSPQLRKNLAQVLEEVARAAAQRENPTVEAARYWQILIMQGLDVPDARSVGVFRGEAGLENIQVRVGANFGSDSAKVASELARFEHKLQELVGELDAQVPAGQEPDADQTAAILNVCAWAHAEWVRIHPFANGNGRTARLWVNSIALRYELPPFLRLRPRPGASYGQARARAMQGEWEPTVAVFRRLLDSFSDEMTEIQEPPQ